MSSADTVLIEAWRTCLCWPRWGGLITAQISPQRHPKLDHPSLWWCRRGSVLLRSLVGDVDLPAGSAALLPPVSTRSEHTPLDPLASGPWELVGIGFTLEPGGHTTPLALLPLPLAWRPTDPLWPTLVERILNLPLRAKSQASRAAARGPLETLLWSAISDLADQVRPSGRPVPIWLAGVRDHLERNLHRRDDIRRIAADAGVSVTHLVRAFKAAYGITPMAWCRKRRLSEAARLLVDLPEDDIREIARRCGYRNLQAFSTAFRKQHGVPPRQWRARRGDADDAAGPGRLE